MLILQPCDIFLQTLKTMEGKFKPCTLGDKTFSAMGVVWAEFVCASCTLYTNWSPAIGEREENDYGEG